MSERETREKTYGMGALTNDWSSTQGCFARPYIKLTPPRMTSIEPRKLGLAQAAPTPPDQDVVVPLARGLVRGFLALCLGSIC